jgi:hypothetical protein
LMAARSSPRSIVAKYGLSCVLNMLGATSIPGHLHARHRLALIFVDSPGESSAAAMN